MNGVDLIMSANLVPRAAGTQKSYFAFSNESKHLKG
jgi:hypothetical protein